jgi:hypothetical protein
MTEDVPRVKTARPIGHNTLRVTFVGERRARNIDLSGLIARSRNLVPLAEDRVFDQAAVVEGGLGVAWPVATKWGRLDLSASTLRRIGEEQEPMTGADFARWRRQLGLSLSETADLLGVGRRTVMTYARKELLPPFMAIACRALARDKHLLAARYIPARKRERPAA